MRLRRSYVSWLIAASYSLAIAFGTFHHHDSAALAADDECCHHAAHGLGHDPHSDGDRGRHGGDPCGHDPSHCLVCQFLGQPSLSPALIDVGPSVRLLAEVEQPAPACPTMSFRVLWHSRAPPQFA
jgi:hypothetical protein